MTKFNRLFAVSAALTLAGLFLVAGCGDDASEADEVSSEAKQEATEALKDGDYKAASEKLKKAE